MIANVEGGSGAPQFSALPWPLAVIDIEASSLDLSGYPIEVGLAVWPAPDAPIFGWSTLIHPIDEWRAHGHWSPVSARVHGIRGSDLVVQGRSPQEVATALNEALGPGAVAWCDGGPYDAQWIKALFKAGRVKPVFTLGDWHRLAAILGGTIRERVLDGLEQASARHRARPDAEALLLVLAQAMDLEVELADNLGIRETALAAVKRSKP